MVIHDGDIGRTGIRPSEDDTPLVVDAYGMESGESPLERFISGVSPRSLTKRLAGDGVNEGKSIGFTF